LEWIFQAEHYFLLTQTGPTQRLPLLPFFMQGWALAWYQWMHKNNQITTWDSFVRALELRFGPSSYDNHQASLFKLHQTGIVVEYQSQFETLANRVLGMTPESLLNYFISG